MFENLQKIFLRKRQKLKNALILPIFPKILNALRYFFARLAKNPNVGKFFEQNSIEKLSFKLFLENLLLKIEPSEIPLFFYNKFSPFGGGNVPNVPLLAPMV